MTPQSCYSLCDLCGYSGIWETSALRFSHLNPLVTKTVILRCNYQILNALNSLATFSHIPLPYWKRAANCLPISQEEDEKQIWKIQNHLHRMQKAFLMCTDSIRTRRGRTRSPTQPLLYLWDNRQLSFPGLDFSPCQMPSNIVC